MCSTDGFCDERDGVDVAAQLLWWEVQPMCYLLWVGAQERALECEAGKGGVHPVGWLPLR